MNVSFGLSTCSEVSSVQKRFDLRCSRIWSRRKEYEQLKQGKPAHCKAVDPDSVPTEVKARRRQFFAPYSLGDERADAAHVANHQRDVADGGDDVESARQCLLVEERMVMVHAGGLVRDRAADDDARHDHCRAQSDEEGVARQAISFIDL